LLRLVLAVLSSFTLWAGAVPTQHARVELVAQKTAATPGARLLLGVHFNLDKDWHIYWINPGDSGQPPSFHWELPAGFSAGEIEWPHPERLANSQLVDYGYKDDVLFMVPVQVPGNVKPGASAQIALDAKWLICREVCIPDKARLQLSLPLSAAPTQDSGNAGLFARTKKLTPKAPPPTWKAVVRSDPSNFVLSIQTGIPVWQATFFPLEAGQIENAAPQITASTPAGFRIRLKKSEQLLKPISRLRGVLVLSGEAYHIDAPVASEPGSKRSN
jgi:DsbC/DsbD-like thiol-disulfide interchange protein